MGGFGQWFMNAEPEAVAFAAEALREIDAANAAAIVQRAVDLVGPGASEAELEAKADELEALDEEFMAYPDNLTELLYGYVDANSELFA
jgi:hypothetical protein